MADRASERMARRGRRTESRQASSGTRCPLSTERMWPPPSLSVLSLERGRGPVPSLIILQRLPIGYKVKAMLVCKAHEALRELKSYQHHLHGRFPDLDSQVVFCPDCPHALLTSLCFPYAAPSWFSRKTPDHLSEPSMGTTSSKKLSPTVPTPS